MPLKHVDSSLLEIIFISGVSGACGGLSRAALGWENKIYSLAYLCTSVIVGICVAIVIGTIMHKYEMSIHYIIGVSYTAGTIGEALLKYFQQRLIQLVVKKDEEKHV